MLASYSLRSLSVVLSTPLKHELTRTLSEIKKAFSLAADQGKNIGSVEFAYVPRKRWRVTYLKSRFKHRKAIRHYVFEQYGYGVRVSAPRDVDVLVASVLGSLAPSVRARCEFVWHSAGASAPPATDTATAAIASRMIAGLRGAAK